VRAGIAAAGRDGLGPPGRFAKLWADILEAHRSNEAAAKIGGESFAHGIRHTFSAAKSRRRNVFVEDFCDRASAGDDGGAYRSVLRSVLSGVLWDLAPMARADDVAALLRLLGDGECANFLSCRRAPKGASGQEEPVLKSAIDMESRACEGDLHRADAKAVHLQGACTKSVSGSVDSCLLEYQASGFESSSDEEGGAAGKNGSGDGSCISLERILDAPSQWTSINLSEGDIIQRGMRRTDYGDGDPDHVRKIRHCYTVYGVAQDSLIRYLRL
jgi:hypothetical protein